MYFIVLSRNTCNMHACYSSKQLSKDQASLPGSGRCITFSRELPPSPVSSHDHEPFHWRRSSIASGNNCSSHDQHLVLLGAFSPAVSFDSLSDCKRLVLTSIFICFRTWWDYLVHMRRFHQLSSPWCLTNLRTLYRPRKFKWPQELISKSSSITGTIWSDCYLMIMAS